MQTENQTAALEEWRKLLGSDHVIVDRGVLASAETATFPIHHRVPAIIRPANTAQVRECLLIASRYSVPVYPVSAGKNWGYGSRVPSADGCVLIELRRMNRILDFSEELGYVTVEPGVTQRQLYSFLQERKSRLWMDASGASPDSSLIGNTVERGFGHTPYGDHFAHSCGFEVVLPNGEVIETGAARFPDCQTAAVNRWGLGPSLDGIFTQSNLGIVTRMSILLMPAPEVFEAFFFPCDAPDALAALIEALRPLRMQELLRSAMHIANDYKVIGGLRQYPWEETGGATPLGPELMAGFRKTMSFGRWNVSGGLYGTKAQVAEAKRLVRKALSGLPGRPRFVSPKLLQLAKRFSGPFKMATGWDIRRTVELVEPVVDLMRGIPTDHALGSCYWRKKNPVPPHPDPDRDRCGLLWYSPVAPCLGSKVEELSSLCIRTILEFGFEPMISLTVLTARLVQCVNALTYDRDVPEEDERAMACYHELAKRTQAAGYYPYRLATASLVEGVGPTSAAGFLSAIKKVVDPGAVLSPGHYDERPLTHQPPSEPAFKR